jgi:hypothetical protein
MEISSSTPPIGADQTPYSYFKQLFPYNLFSPNFEPEDQAAILFRMEKLIEHSRPMTDDEASIRYVKRNKDGVCCHPVFLTMDEARELYKKLDKIKVEPDKLYPLDGLVSIMIRKCMLVGSRRGNRLYVDKSYPELFEHGDFIGLVDIPDLEYEDDEFEFFGLRTKYIYVWLHTKSHPTGYPYKLGNTIDPTNSNLPTDNSEIIKMSPREWGLQFDIQ